MIYPKSNKPNFAYLSLANARERGLGMESINATYSVEQMLKAGPFAEICQQVISECATASDKLIAEEVITKVLARTRDAINDDRDTIMDLPAIKFHVNRWGWSFVRAGVVVRNRLGQYLCIEETRGRVNGVYQDVYGIWNLPAGSAKNPTESFLRNAAREVEEETGYKVEITGLLFIKRKLSAGSPHIMAVYEAKIVDDTPHDFDRKEIRSLRWMSCEEIMELKCQDKLRSPDFVLEAVRRCENNKPLPLSTILES